MWLSESLDLEISTASKTAVLNFEPTRLQSLVRVGATVRVNAIRWAAITVALVAASGSGAIAAETGAIHPDGIPERPVLAGDRALWTESARTRVDVWSGASGEDPRRVERVRFNPGPGAAESALVGRLTASPSLALLSTFAYVNPGDNLGLRPAFSQHHLGPVDGPLDGIARCDGEAGFGLLPSLRPADVWQQAYAYWQCDDGNGHVEVRDTAAQPLSPARAVGDGGEVPRIAGRFVAWLEPGSEPGCGGPGIVVYDRVADAEVYRVSRCELGRLHSFDLQDDGKVAFAFENNSAQDVVVGWASPEEPFIHRLDLPEADFYDVRIGSDRIAYQGGRRALVWSVPRADVGIADLSGDSRLIARNTDALLLDQSFDYDGGRVVWREFRCERRRLVIRSVTAIGVAPGSATDCPLRLRRLPVVESRAVTFRFGCGAFEPPCNFVARLRIVGHGGGPASRATYGENLVRVRFTRRARRLLRREGSLRVRANVQLTDAAARFQTRRKTLVLRRD